MPFRSPRARVSWVIAPLIFISATIYCLRSNEIPRTAFFGGDTWQYQPMAVNFAAGHGLKVGAILPYDRYKFGNEIQADYGEVRKTFIEIGERGGDYNFVRQPGYPFLLGVLYKIVGVRPDIAMLLQMLTIIGIGSLLPVLGERLLGSRGLIAGVPAGIALSFFAAPAALAILTESLIALACFIVVVTSEWICRRDDLPSGILFGLTLAFALFAKGSLIFIPPIFIAYMVVRSVRSGAYPARVIIGTIIGVTIPLVAYSSWASSWAGKPILLSEQGRDILLDSHNEYAVETGVWSPQWVEDPASFHSRALHSEPHQSGLELVTAYYLANPNDLLPTFIRKLEVLGETNGPVSRLAINWLFALCFLYTTVKALQDVGAATRWCFVIGVAIIIIVSHEATLVSLAGLAVVTVAGLRSRTFREHIRAIWESPRVAALIFVGVNFLLLTVITYASERFVWPGFSVLLLGTFYLILRIPEELGILSGLPRQLEADASRAPSESPRG